MLNIVLGLILLVIGFVLYKDLFGLSKYDLKSCAGLLGTGLMLGGFIFLIYGIGDGELKELYNAKSDWPAPYSNAQNGKYKISLYQGAVPPYSHCDKKAFIAYHRAMIEWAEAKKIDRVYLDFSDLGTYQAQTIDNVAKILESVPEWMQVGVVLEASPTSDSYYKEAEKGPDGSPIKGGWGPDPKTWKKPDGFCANALQKALDKANEEVCNKPGQYAQPSGMCHGDNDRCIWDSWRGIEGASGSGSGFICDTSKGDENLCCMPWPGIKNRDKPPQPIGTLDYPTGCPDQLQRALNYIRLINEKSLTNGGQPITSIIVDEENVQQYATNIYLYVGAVNYFLREPLNKINDKWDNAFEVGQAGGGSMNPQALMDAADAICKADESLDCSYAKTLISNTGKGPIAIVAYPELYWYMDELKQQCCVGCDHGLQGEQLSYNTLDGCKGICGDYMSNDWAKSSNWTPNDCANEDTSPYSQCMNSVKEGDELCCKCLGCVGCKYALDNSGKENYTQQSDECSGHSGNPSKSGDWPNPNILYQSEKFDAAKTLELIKQKIGIADGCDNPCHGCTDGRIIKAGTYATTLRPMFSIEVSHDWDDVAESNKIKGATPSADSCVGRRLGNDTCGTFDGFGNWTWENFKQFLDKWHEAVPESKEVAIYEWQFVAPEWLKGTSAAETLSDYNGTEPAGLTPCSGGGGGGGGGGGRDCSSNPCTAEECSKGEKYFVGYINDRGDPHCSVCTPDMDISNCQCDGSGCDPYKNKLYCEGSCQCDCSGAGPGPEPGLLWLCDKDSKTCKQDASGTYQSESECMKDCSGAGPGPGPGPSGDCDFYWQYEGHCSDGASGLPTPPSQCYSDPQCSTECDCSGSPAPGPTPPGPPADECQTDADCPNSYCMISKSPKVCHGT